MNARIPVESARIYQVSIIIGGDTVIVKKNSSTSGWQCNGLEARLFWGDCDNGLIKEIGPCSGPISVLDVLRSRRLSVGERDGGVGLTRAAVG